MEKVSNNEDMIDALYASLDFAGWNTWSKDFIESLENATWEKLSDKQQLKVIELYQDLQHIHLPIHHAKTHEG